MPRRPGDRWPPRVQHGEVMPVGTGVRDGDVQAIALAGPQRRCRRRRPRGPPGSPGAGPAPGRRSSPCPPRRGRSGPVLPGARRRPARAGCTVQGAGAGGGSSPASAARRASSMPTSMRPSVRSASDSERQSTAERVGPHRALGRTGLAIEGREVGVRAEARQAAGPGADPAGHATQVTLGIGDLLRPAGHAEAHAAAHGPELEVALEPQRLGRHLPMPHRGERGSSARLSRAGHGRAPGGRGRSSRSTRTPSSPSGPRPAGAGAFSWMTFAPAGAFWPGLSRT